MKPITPSRLGISPGTGAKVKRCSKTEKKTKSSILARGSPKHIRLPALRNGTCLINICCSILYMYMCNELKSDVSASFGFLRKVAIGSGAEPRRITICL